MEYYLFRTFRKYTFRIIECARLHALNMPKKSFFLTSDYLHSADSLKKYLMRFLRFLMLCLDYPPLQHLLHRSCDLALLTNCCTAPKDRRLGTSFVGKLTGNRVFSKD